MGQQPTTYRYKLDFYYQQSLMYLVTLILYAGVRGTFSAGWFEIVWNDPFLYIILTFVVISFVMLGLNRLRDRRLVIEDGALVFVHRFHELRVELKDIEWMHIGRERNVQTSGRFQVVVLKMRHRRRTFRIRIGRYEREGELLDEMQRIASKVPRRHRKRFSLR